MGGFDDGAMGSWIWRREKSGTVSKRKPCLGMEAAGGGVRILGCLFRFYMVTENGRRSKNVEWRWIVL